MDVPKPTSEQKRLWMGMARLVSHLAREAGQVVEAAEGINLSEMTLMGQVEALGGSARMVDLAVRLQVSKAAITKIVDSLERLAYLKRGRSQSDRRVIYAELTPEGSHVRARAGAVFESIMQAGLWDHLSTEETSGMVKLLERLQATLGLSQGSLMPPSP